MDGNPSCCKRTVSLQAFLGMLAVGVAVGLIISFTSGDPGQETAEAAGPLKLKKIGTFDQPVYVAQPRSGGNVYIVEREGTVRVIRKGRRLSRPLFNFTSRINSDNQEQGLLSIAFAPDFRTSRRVYAYYTANDGDQVVAEVRANDTGTRVVSGPRQVLRMSDSYGNHNGGQLQFGPDGFLYIGTGDGGGAGDPERVALDPDSLLGKILRIHPRPSAGQPYSSPDSNPFAGGGGRPEVYALGLRNPWRFSFDSRRDLIAIGDVGQSDFEEVNVIGRTAASGRNFGWSALEGTSSFNSDQNAVDPVPPTVSYSHGSGCSVTGGYLVRNPKLPALDGRYLYADYCARNLRSFRISEAGAAVDRRTERISVPFVTSFGRGANGQIWVASGSGPVYRIHQD